MGASTLSKISEFINGVFNLMAGLSGIGFWLFAIGFVLLVLIALVILGRILYVMIRAIPNMTISQFVKFIVALAIVLMIVGILVP